MNRISWEWLSNSVRSVRRLRVHHGRGLQLNFRLPELQDWRIGKMNRLEPCCSPSDFASSSLGGSVASSSEGGSVSVPSLGSSAWFLCRTEESPAWTLEVVWPAASVLFWGLQPVSRLSRPAIQSGKYSVPQSPRDCWHKADRAPSPAPSLCSKVGRMPELSSAICCYCTLLCSTLLCSTLLCSSLGGSSRCAGLANALDRPCTSSRGCQRALKQVATPLSGSGLGCLDEGPGKEPLLQATARPQQGRGQANRVRTRLSKSVSSSGSSGGLGPRFA